MKKQLILATCLALTPYLVVAAEPAATDTADTHRSATERSTMHEGDASNTGINKRDRDDQTLTPMDQMNNESDLKITQDIRKALMDGDFSMDAKNIKVITRNGVVTLRGPVDTAAELAEISVLVKSIPGIKSVDNQLEVN